MLSNLLENHRTNAVNTMEDTDVFPDSQLSQCSGSPQTCIYYKTHYILFPKEVKNYLSYGTKCHYYQWLSFGVQNHIIFLLDKSGKHICFQNLKPRSNTQLCIKDNCDSVFSSVKQIYHTQVDTYTHTQHNKWHTVCRCITIVSLLLFNKNKKCLS